MRVSEPRQAAQRRRHSAAFETDISDVVSHRPLSNAFIYDGFSYFREPFSQSFVIRLSDVFPAELASGPGRRAF